MTKTNTQTTALLLIDLLNDCQFQHGETLASKAKALVPNILACKQYFYQHNWPVVYINDHYELWQADYDKILAHCQNELTKDWISQYRPTEKDEFLIKPRHSAFFGTALHTFLHERGVNTVWLAGLAGNICVLFTANDAYMRDFSLVVPQDASASVSENDQAYALTMMQNVLKARVAPTVELTQS
ncbi:isochorismatase family cysteine hydrolase [Bacillus fonticola]|uniref:isochorismatase family cysteine hydrolase n=1 Tax=Bacillus fonticola TaxID=2728853 RepID=UPI001472B44F|nr:isochorismatase family cysteine hydrolase [Bacillus fonticola]